MSTFGFTRDTHTGLLGNVLVCLSVLTERSLKTATNYFIISLAVADLLLAVLVLPLYVYSEVSVNEDRRYVRSEVIWTGMISALRSVLTRTGVM